ncbi:hypothetical protein BFW01_g7517 [Lasiodiplodia theobromae]|uniref:uncharacterized protein n=1 Tax=Lasiodiplodia theobromae TaxID=45133 RepID=UPI0015C32784|nr:uncharacterized protein LTHEOB_11462 [Lasiodiplodia theobromae]KAF4537690.1 hypothetical protein LTHEOB_11462 [Lasiodiplodia theobromae]KAF9636621.1 hypothetical protein BFW01_g7517 [Lasiodiplodia theobromae]
MKFFTALTSALAFTTTAIAAPLAMNETEPFALEERGTPLQNVGITVFHSKEETRLGRWTLRFRMMGFLQATGAMYDILTEQMGVNADTGEPVARASVVAQGFFANLRPWYQSTFPDVRPKLFHSLFNAGSNVGEGWEGTVGAQFWLWAEEEATYDRILEALKAYLSGKGSNPVDVIFSRVPDAFAVGDPKQYLLPRSKLRARSDTCSSGTSLISQFQNRVPEIPTFSGADC